MYIFFHNIAKQNQIEKNTIHSFFLFLESARKKQKVRGSSSAFLFRDMNADFPVSEYGAKQVVKRVIANAFGIRQELTHNPCAAPTSLLRTHLPLIQHGYVVTEKSDGVRYLLVFARVKKTLFACLVDRAMAMFQVQTRAPTHLFEGSVFDCELVQSRAPSPSQPQSQPQSQLPSISKLLVFDCLQLRGTSLRKRTFTNRYAKLQQYIGVDKITCTDLEVVAKSFLPLSDVAQIKVKELGHASDGFILQPVDGRVVWGRDKRCFKWKYNPSIDVVLDGPRVQCLEGSLPKDMDWVVDGSVEPGLWECDASVSERGGRTCVTLKPLRQRADKLEPNSRETIVGVVREIKDAVQLWELAPAM